MRHGSPSARQAAVGPLSTPIRHRFSSAVSGDESGDLLGLRPVLTHSPPYFVTGKNFLRISWRSVDVIALSPIGVRVIGDEPFISLHEFTHDPYFLA
jgi:hypothetical protein